MSSKIKIDFQKMRELNGSVTRFCKVNRIQREVLYNIHGNGRLDADNTLSIFTRLKKMGLAEWEINTKDNKC